MNQHKQIVIKRHADTVAEHKAIEARLIADRNAEAWMQSQEQLDLMRTRAATVHKLTGLGGRQ